MTDQITTQGTFIVIEGTDGSGKGTQFDLLARRLAEAGHQVVLFDFPQYSSPSSYFVKEYLNGNYGTAEQVGPYTGSLFYALDRYQASMAIRKALAQGKIVLSNRFTGSNMAHQGTKFTHAEERRGYFIWLDNLEFEMLHIPRPDRSFVLRVPAETAQQLVDQKEQRSYTDKKRDIHEADLAHLQKSVQVYDDLCSLFPKDFTRIDCVRSGTLMSIPQIHDMLWETVQPLLPKVAKDATGSVTKSVAPTVASATSGPTASALDTASNHAAVSAPVKAATSGTPVYVTKDQDKQFTITPDGMDFLQQAVTNTTGNVYAFTDKLSTTTIAAAMARLSRRGDDMRITILDEFASAAGKDAKLLQRVITAYGDDSVQQLVGQHVVVEGASNILTKKLEWGRLGSYLEQSTRYIYFDQKDKQGNYKYYTPDSLSKKTRAMYNQYMDALFDLYSDMVRKITDYVRDNDKTPKQGRDVAWMGATRAQACDAARAVLPVAVKCTVGIYASGQALESLIMHLLADELPEARTTGQELLKEGRKVMQTFLERADKPERGGAMVAYKANTYNAVHQLADKILNSKHTGKQQDITLTDIWPKNELDLCADMLYEHSDMPLGSIREAVQKMSIKQKEEIMRTYFGERLNRRHRPGRALEKAHYSWDLVCDYGIFRDLQRHRMVDDMEWQQLTPRYGYEVPKLVEDAGLTDSFEKCFEISLELYSILQNAGHALEAQYATLLGHKMRWKVTYNAREAFHLHELRTSPQGHPGYRKLVLGMHAVLAEAHPLLAEGMKFVNTDEDPELTRLAAERATQYKLQNL
jgi:thymidylate kinase/thymidylate synthase ThyX